LGLDRTKTDERSGRFCRKEKEPARVRRRAGSMTAGACGTALCCAVFSRKTIFCQDRLGIDIEAKLRKGTVFLCGGSIADVGNLPGALVSTTGDNQHHKVSVQ
jgi:hypothetical protein